jgi:hypothetical protein
LIGSRTSAAVIPLERQEKSGLEGGWNPAGIRLESGLPLFHGLLTRGDHPEAV